MFDQGKRFMLKVYVYSCTLSFDLASNSPIYKCTVWLKSKKQYSNYNFE